MRQLRAWLLRLAALLNKERRARELAEELENHLQMHIEDNLRSGMSPEEALRQALIKLGGVDQTKEIYRDRRGHVVLETLLQDFRHAGRMLRKDPGFTLAVMFTLAVGIAANTTIFSWIDLMLLRPIPGVTNGHELVAIETVTPNGEFIPTSYPDYRDCRSADLFRRGTLSGCGCADRQLRPRAPRYARGFYGCPAERVALDVFRPRSRYFTPEA